MKAISAIFVLISVSAATASYADQPEALTSDPTAYAYAYAGAYAGDQANGLSNVDDCSDSYGSTMERVEIQCSGMRTLKSSGDRALFSCFFSFDLVSQDLTPPLSYQITKAECL